MSSSNLDAPTLLKQLENLILLSINNCAMGANLGLQYEGSLVHPSTHSEDYLLICYQLE